MAEAKFSDTPRHVNYPTQWEEYAEYIVTISTIKYREIRA